MKRDTNKITGGFTLVELLTVLAVVGVLLALLVPALTQVQKTAVKVKQKAQFHAIGTALESFRSDTGDYPPSAFNNIFPNAVTASHNLAESLVGRDGLGFHPSSEFRGDGRADFNGNGTYDADEEVYHATVSTPYETAADNLAARKGPYLEIESANAVKVESIFPTSYGSLNKTAYVLVDMYKINKNTATGKEVGMPILYYKANKLKIGNDPNPATSLNWTTNTYNLGDSYCMGSGFIEGPTHFGGNVNANASIFYNAIQNPNFPGPPARPYRAESFLLHSAGPDGLYGTTDDMFNFDQDN